MLSRTRDVEVGDSGRSDFNYARGSVFPVSDTHSLVFQDDGNLVLYYDGRPVWATGTNAHNPVVLSVQSDGNTVLYDAAGTPCWATNTSGKGLRFVVRSDGNLVVVDPDGNLCWESGTAGGVTGDLQAGESWARRSA